MTEDESRLVLYRHYQTLWYGQSWGDPLTGQWQDEYTAVAAGAFAPLLITSSGFDGGSASAQKQFEQQLRVQVLQNFRAALDPDYRAAVTAPMPIETARPTVMYPHFAGNFAH